MKLILVAVTLLGTTVATAQVKADLGSTDLGKAGLVIQNLPATPVPQHPQEQSVLQAPATSLPARDTSPQAEPVPSNTLTLQQAEATALKNNPLISVARLTALASQQVTREARSAFWPTATANLTAVDSRDGSRITAGGLNNPIIYRRAAGGVTVTQLITDFGRTKNLTASADLNAKAENQNAAATREQILLAVDQAFYGALQSQAVLVVARQTVAARQSVADQIGALFNSKLKSQLDLSFANVNLAQAQLLALDAENNQQAALATLCMIMGYADTRDFTLADDTVALTAPASNIDDLIGQAMTSRPELLALRFQEQAAQKFTNAEHDLKLPDVTAVGVTGDTPVRDPILSNWYGAVGVNVQIPIFNGFLYSAREKEAALKAQAAHDRLSDLRNHITRDVRTSWLNANAAFARVSVTQQLLSQANLALDLAPTRYNMGLSSIVELSQAQLQQTQAQISNAEAAYDFKLTSAILRYETTGI